MSRPRGDGRPTRKISPEIRLMLVQMRREGWPYAELARVADQPLSTVYRLFNADVLGSGGKAA